jgi:hypothetical protein
MSDRPGPWQLDRVNARLKREQVRERVQQGLVGVLVLGLAGVL